MSREDVDSGDACPTEVKRFVPHVWHESMKPARVPELPTAKTEVGARALAALRACTGAGMVAMAKREAAPVVSWRDMPELYRRMVVAAAGLGREVVDKADRELSEREKVMMRSAISDMRAWLSTVAAL